MSPDSLTTIFVSALGLAFSVTFARLTRKRMKELTIQAGDERSETVQVRMGASSSEIAATVRRALDYETQLYTYLSAVLRETGHVTISHGSGPDFLVDLAGRRLAIEAKWHLRGLHASDLRKYLKHAPDVERLLVVSPETPTRRLLEELHGTSHWTKVAFIQVPEGLGAGENLLRALAGE